MTDEEIIHIMNDRMAREFEIDPAIMTPDKRLIEDLGMDSLDFVDLVIVLQDAFGVKLRDEPKIRGIVTLGDLQNLVLDKKRQLEAQGK